MYRSISSDNSFRLWVDQIALMIILPSSRGIRGTLHRVPSFQRVRHSNYYSNFGIHSFKSTTATFVSHSNIVWVIDGRYGKLQTCTPKWEQLNRWTLTVAWAITPSGSASKTGWLKSRDQTATQLREDRSSNDFGGSNYARYQLSKWSYVAESLSCSLRSVT
jgi:hypothetical protein